MYKNSLIPLTILLLLLINLSAQAENNIKIEKIVDGLGVVWAMDFIDESHLIFTQRDGFLGILNLNNKKIKQIKGLPNIMVAGQGGLMDVKIHEEYIYFTYVKDLNGKGITVLSRAKLINDKLVDWQDLLLTKSATDTNRHFGSRITFDNNNHIFFSVGDRGVRANGQNLKTHAGSIIRLNLDGTVPADNPFVGDKNKLDEIFSFGHRNPQGLFYDKKRDILFSVEHGPRGGDEINIIKKGENYGWATVSKGKEYTSFSYVGDYRSKKGMRDAIKVYIPSIAPSSLMVYSGKLIKKWQDDLLIGSLVLTHINKITFLNKNFTKSQEIRLLKNLNQRIRDVTESPQGFICFSTDSGDIYKISPLTPL